MINHLNGKLAGKNPAYLVIECGGVGYFVNISLHTYSKVADDELIKLFTHLHVTEDAHTLYGFADEEERKLFRLLVTVSGVGCNTARMMLSSMSPQEIEDCIVSENAGRLKAIKGIGEKTALRIILELKSKIKKDGNVSPVSHLRVKDEAMSALLTLGFNRQSIDKTLDSLIKSAPSMALEELIKNALKAL